jgi:PAS domain S-box-containing protein
MAQWLSAALIFLGGAAPLSHGAEDGAGPVSTARALTNASQVLQLSAAEANRAHPVQLRGVVTYFNNAWQSLFLQDVTAGIYVSPPYEGAWRAGDMMEVEGVTSAGQFAPMVRPSRQRVVGRAPLPPAQPASFEALISGRQECQWVEVEGLVRSARVEFQQLALELAVGPARLTAWVKEFESPDPTRLIEARAKVRGVCTAVFNSRRQITGTQILVSSLAEVTLQGPAVTNAFALPLRPINTLLNYTPGEASARVRVRGIVTLHRVNEALFLRDETGSLQVGTGQTMTLEPGEEVEAVGFPGFEAGHPILQDAIFQRTGRTAPLVPTRLTVNEMVPASCHGDLVSLEGKLIDHAKYSAPTSGGKTETHLLVLDVEKRVVTVELMASASEPALASLEEASQLRVTGVCLMPLHETHTSHAIRLLARSSADITVLRFPPWWRRTRVVMVLGLAGAGAFALLGWLAALQQRARARAERDHARAVASAQEARSQAQAARAELGAIFERATDAVVALDRHWSCTYVNARAGELFGRKPMDLVGKHLWTEFPEIKDQPFQRAYEKAMATQEAAEFEEYYAAWDRWFENRVYPSPEGLSVFLHEITDRKRAELALRESEQRFAKVFRSSPLGISISTLAEGRFLDVNAAFTEMFGFAPEDVIGRTSAELGVWSDSLDRRALVEEMKTKRVLHNIERRFWKKSGQPTWASCSAEVIELGGQECLLVLYDDITARKQGEALLNGQKEVLELIAAGTPLAQTLDTLLRGIEAQSAEMLCSILLLDADGVHVRHGSAPSLPESFTRAIDGAAIGASAGSCGTAAFRRQPVIVEDIATDPLWADYRELALSHGLRACWSTPICDGQDRVLGTFALYFRAPGRPSESHLRLIEMVTHIAAVAISKRREEEALRASESRYRSLVEISPDAIWINRGGHIVFANRAAFALFGAERPGDLLGKSPFDLTHPDSHEAVRERIRKLQAGQPLPLIEQKIRRLDGGAVDVELAATAMTDAEGRATQVVARDITERKAQEELRRKNEELQEQAHVAEEASRLKSEFLSNMSHELRTPLNAVIGFSEFLVDEKAGPLNGRQREYLNDVLQSGRHLLQLINDVLDLAKVEAGKMELFPETFSVPQALAEICAVTQALAQKRQVTLRSDVSPGLDQVTLDPKKFKQVLFNLLSNAVKFSHAGGNVEVTARRLEAGPMELCVRDHGIGIRRKDLPRLFTEFEQLESGHARRHEGSGLGLALTRRMVELQGGTIAVESIYGVGTTFTITLPVGPPKVLPSTNPIRL